MHRGQASLTPFGKNRSIKYNPFKAFYIKNLAVWNSVSIWRVRCWWSRFPITIVKVHILCFRIVGLIGVILSKCQITNTNMYVPILGNYILKYFYLLPLNVLPMSHKKVYTFSSSKWSVCWNVCNLEQLVYLFNVPWFRPGDSSSISYGNPKWIFHFFKILVHFGIMNIVS